MAKEKLIGDLSWRLLHGRGSRAALFLWTRLGPTNAGVDASLHGRLIDIPLVVSGRPSIWYPATGKRSTSFQVVHGLELGRFQVE